MTNVVINYSSLMNQILYPYGYFYTGDLKNRSMRISGTFAKAFVPFHASTNVIRCSALDSKSAGIVILQKFLDSPPILCHNQYVDFIFHLISIVCGYFLSAQTKIVTKQLSKIR